MKKFVVLLVVVAMTCISSIAFAETALNVSGGIDIRSRDFMNMDMNSDTAVGDTASIATTQERVTVNIDAKVGDSKGRISIQNDWDTWGRFEQYQADASTGTFLRLREAWVNFNVPFLPLNVNAGHQLLQLSNGWFFRSMKYGSDAWVVANVTGPNTAALVNVKFAEGDPVASDDEDAYVILDVLKLNDDNLVGINITDLKDRLGKAAVPSTNVDLQNIGLHYTGKLGPVGLNAELDVQGGKIETAGAPDEKFKGNQIVVQGNVALEPVTINFTVARGTGEDLASTSPDIKQIQTALDADRHYTLIYEYLIPNPTTGGLHTGFANTTALNVGASFAVAKSLTLGADLWYLQATEDVPDTQNPGGTTTSLGNEIDVRADWQVADNLSWNWTVGYLMPGDGLGKDAATAIQGILSYKF